MVGQWVLRVFGLGNGLCDDVRRVVVVGMERDGLQGWRGDGDWAWIAAVWPEILCGFCRRVNYYGCR